MWAISEHTKTGIRMGLGVFITCGLCYGVILPQMKPGSKYSSAVFNAGKAAGITTVVVNAPLMGRVTEVGLDRSVGTILGGLAGFLTVWMHYQFLHSPLEGKAELGLMLSFAAFWAAWGSVEAGWRIARLETTPRLFTLTFLLVAFGTTGGDIRGDFVTLISRITGILSGVIVSLVLAVIVFPKSATQETLSRMKLAFESLLELSDAAWPKQLEDGDTHSNNHDGDGLMFSTSSSRALKGQPIHLKVNRKCEDALLSVFASLRRCIECGPLTKAEIYLGSIQGHLMFLPGLPMRWAVCGGWSLDLHSLEGLENSLSRVSRLIWALHLTFNEGISEHFAQILSQQYPRSLLPELQQSCQACLREMMEAFSSTSKIVETGNLTRFTRAVEGLMRISDYHRREQLNCLREARRVREGHPPCVPEEDESLESDASSPSAGLQQPYKASGTNWSRDESPSQAFWDLPKGLDIRVGPSQRAVNRRATFRRQDSMEVRMGTSEEPGSTRMTVKRIEPDEMLLFPETVEGMVAQVKWNSFMFLTEELVEGLQDAHVNLTNLIATLPCDNINL